LFIADVSKQMGSAVVKLLKVKKQVFHHDCFDG